MYPWCSFLQTVCQFVKNIFTPVVNMTKRLYRSAAVIMAGTAVVAVMTFSSAGFAAGGLLMQKLLTGKFRTRKHWTKRWKRSLEKRNC